MPSLRYSRDAERDLEEITAFTISTWGIEQAARYIKMLENACGRLSQNPGMGRPCDDILPGLRRMEQGSHVVFYQLDVQGITVFRILHQRMLPNRE